MAFPKALLTEAAIQSLLQAAPEWRLHGGKLVREWTFPSFAEAIGFVNQVAAIAEEADHHPDISIRYVRVELSLSSHDAGGLTARDAAMALRLSKLP